jgi:hypothetical protein
VLRNTHLLVGLALFAFLLMYGVSSVQMAHNRWFTLKPATTESRVTLPAGLAENPRAVARRLMDEYGVRGELNQIRKTETGCNLRIVRPGTVYEIAYSAPTGEAQIRKHIAGFMGLLNRLHHVGGLWHEYALINVWGALVGVVSLGLFVMGLTGIYLWFKIHNERVIGTILLAISLGYSLTLMVLLRAV